MEQPTDLDALVRAARAGDENAFESLVFELQGRFRAFARRFLNSDGDGDDAAQETFIRIWSRLNRWDPTQKFEPWAWTVLRNVCIDRSRKRRRPPALRGSPAPDPASAITERVAVENAIDQLSDEHRRAILLWQIGCSYDEISVIESVPLGTVRSRIHTAKAQLAVALAPSSGGTNDN